MYKFSKRSKDNLDTAHEDLQLIFNEVIKHIDCTVISGYRSPEEQNKLYQQGRTEPGNIVTNIDGYTKKSKHNYSPSLAVDVVPYPIDWNDIDKFKTLAISVKTIADQLNIGLTWGGDWSRFRDYPHYQLK